MPQDTLPPDPCRIPDPGTYTGRENHLYRVEIHDGGDVTPTGATFKIPLAADANAGEVTVTLARALEPVQLDALARGGVVLIQDIDGHAEVVPINDASGTTLNLARGLSQAYTMAKEATIVGDVARFKWSRDNAAFAVRVLDVRDSRQTLALASLGRDQVTALQAGDLVEICDDASALGPARGHLTMLAATPDPDLLTVSLVDPLPATFTVARHLLLRRWDGWGWANTIFDEISTADMNLGDGIHIQFSGSNLQPGDYWNFTARSADGSVEPLTNAVPAGITRYGCPLAVVRWAFEVDDQVSTLKFRVLEDCRNRFPPLTNLTSLFYVSGDGQEVTPGTVADQFLPLPQPLCVGIANGSNPVAGARVRFQVLVGSGQLQNGGLSAEIVTEPDGLACCAWSLDRQTPSQQVEARLLASDGSTVHLPVIFTANLDTGGAPTFIEQCEVTVGKGGQFATLREARDALQFQKRPDWCICLLPGDHQLTGGLEISDTTHINIHACTPGARIILLDKPFLVSDVESFALSGVSVKSNLPQTLLFQGCSQVTLDNLMMQIIDVQFDGNQEGGAITCVKCGQVTMRDLTVTAPDTALHHLVRIEGAQAVTLESCRMNGGRQVDRGIVLGKGTGLIQLIRNIVIMLGGDTTTALLPGVALVIDTGDRNTTLDGNIIAGTISLYGEPGGDPLKKEELDALSAGLRQGLVKFGPTNGVFQARGNRLNRIVVARQTLDQLRSVISGGEITLSVYESFLFTDNVIEAPGNTLVAERLSVVSTIFQQADTPPSPPPRVGVVVGLAATFASNHTPVPKGQLLNLAPTHQEAANLIDIHTN